MNRKPTGEKQRLKAPTTNIDEAYAKGGKKLASSKKKELQSRTKGKAMTGHRLPLRGDH